MSFSDELRSSLKSLRLALKQSFVLKAQCNTLISVLQILDADVEKDPSVYKDTPKLSFYLIAYMKKVLRFVRLNFKVTERFPEGLGDLRRARSLVNVNNLRIQMNTFVAELELLLLSSSVKNRLGSQLAPLFGGNSSLVSFTNDSNKLIEAFHKTFENLVGLFNDKERSESALANLSSIEVGAIAKQMQKFQIEYVDTLNLNAGSGLEHFENHIFNEFSYVIEGLMLDMVKPVKYSDLRYLDQGPIKKGRFGEVYVGTLGGPQRVCIQKISKKQLEDLSSEGRIKLGYELRVALSKTHENLISCVGVCKNEGNLYVVMEKVDLTLNDLLHGHGGHESGSGDQLGPRTFTPSEILAVFLGVSKGLEFLHKDGYVHGDIRPDNIFFGRNKDEGYVKLANFSYGLNLDEIHWCNWNEEGLVYQAPEVLGNKKFSFASDIYSLAVCLWEITQDDKRPFGHLDLEKIDLCRLVKSGVRPEFSMDNTEPKWLVDLAKIAWSNDPWDRPAALRLRNLFESIVSKKKINEDEIKSFISSTLKRRQHTKNAMSSMAINDASKIPREPPREVVLHNGNKNGPPPPEKTRSEHYSESDEVQSITFDNLPKQHMSGQSRPLPPLDDDVMSASDLYNKSIQRPLPPLDPQGGNFQAGTPMMRQNTIETINSFEDQQNMKEVTQAGASVANASQGGVMMEMEVGRNGLTKPQVKEELLKFYRENDPKMIAQIDTLTDWCMKHGMKKFNDLLMDKFGKGLQMFDPNAQAQNGMNINGMYAQQFSPEDQAMIANKANGYHAPNQKKEKGKVRKLFGMTIGRNKKNSQVALSMSTPELVAQNTNVLNVPPPSGNASQGTFYSQASDVNMNQQPPPQPKRVNPLMNRGPPPGL